MVQKDFADVVVEKIRTDDTITGLAVGGSWLTGELDEFSDLDLVLVTNEKVTPDKEKMLSYANRFGKLLSAFTGDHVGEPRVLICLYETPLLHVDIKFLTPSEFAKRVEDPVVLFERNEALTTIIQSSSAQWPKNDHQWIEDRFWVWIHYAALKMGRGEYFEALDFLSFLRIAVLAPLLQEKNGKLPRALRKVETHVSKHDLEKLKGTVTAYEPEAIFNALENAISLYKDLRKEIFSVSVVLQTATEQKVIAYLGEIKRTVAFRGPL